MQLYYPFYFGASAVTVSTATSTTTPVWTTVSATAKTWQDGPTAGIVPRFNRLYQQEAGAPQFSRATIVVH